MNPVEDSFFDELEKISAALFGGAVGAGTAAAGALSREMKKRSDEDPSDPVTAAKRKRRLKYMAGGVAAGGAGGALLGHAAKKGLNAVGDKVRREIDSGVTEAVGKATGPGGDVEKMVDRIAPKIRTEAGKVVDDAMPKIRSQAVAAAEEAAEKAPSAVGRGVGKAVGRAASKLKNFGMAAGTRAARIFS